MKMWRHDLATWRHPQRGRNYETQVEQQRGERKTISFRLEAGRGSATADRRRTVHAWLARHSLGDHRADRLLSNRPNRAEHSQTGTNATGTPQQRPLRLRFC